MKAHRRNSSLLTDKLKKGEHTHHRSFSYTRYCRTLPSHHKRTSNFNLNHLSPENFATDSAALPFSIELSREFKCRRKKIDQEIFKQLHKEKRKRKSKEQESASRQKKMDVEVRAKKSSEKIERNGKVESKELL
jgi:hypothetical protein